MTVGPDLLKAAQANDPDAFDMVSIWGLGFKAELGGSLAPGTVEHQGAQRVCSNRALGVFIHDLMPAIPIRARLTPPRRSRCPRRSSRERDMMTPARRQDARRATPNARTVVLRARPHDDGRSARRIAGSVG